MNKVTLAFYHGIIRWLQSGFPDTNTFPWRCRCENLSRCSSGSRNPWNYCMFWRPLPISQVKTSKDLV